jgi:hypothetical protein
MAIVILNEGDGFNVPKSNSVTNVGNCGVDFRVIKYILCEPAMIGSGVGCRPL